MNTQFVLNKNIERLTLENEKNKDKMEIEKNMHKFPVEQFSSETQALEIKSENIDKIDESKNSSFINNMAKGFDGKHLQTNQADIAPKIQQAAIDNLYTLQRDKLEINPHVEQKLIVPPVLKNTNNVNNINRQKSKKRKIDIYNF